MGNLVVFKSSPNGMRWHVMRDDKVVKEYSIQIIAERAATRLAKVAAKRGMSARTMFFRQDGSIGVESSYGLAT